MLPFELTKDTPYLALSASYGVSFMSTWTEIDRVIKGFYCSKALRPMYLLRDIANGYNPQLMYHIYRFLEASTVLVTSLPIGWLQY